MTIAIAGLTKKQRAIRKILGKGNQRYAYPTLSERRSSPLFLATPLRKSWSF
ncbi:hypothetical protein [Microseira sp. BLCC-F43]|uniref:hypothetical protein n=1 Tax=Microseira sp. BLCC-F43 TaxID=3153602 RepID=UPI0035B9C274